MYNYDKNYISKRASEYGFIRDTLEKVYRLANILEYLNKEPMIKGKLALKGGTAINLTIFNLPRLSVDIDLDYVVNDNREEILTNMKLNRLQKNIEAFDTGRASDEPRKEEIKTLVGKFNFRKIIFLYIILIRRYNLKFNWRLNLCLL
ncbi:UNVERIFIED_CONTAM: nucleotidyltransferase AbiEii toxin of type IV toxin-antitoxin system [Acetivibrio alkalicellulosi]